MTMKFHGARAAGLTASIALLAACASSQSEPEGPAVVEMDRQITENWAQGIADPPSPDPRVGLAAGATDAAEAIWNLRLVSNTPTPEPFAGATNSDLAFQGNYAIQGNYNGFLVWDVSNPAMPTLRKGFFCPSSQNDVSVYGDLLFMSGEGLSGRLDCGGEGVDEAVSSDRLRGIRIFDISDLDNPVNVGNVQTCRGSHTHSLLVDPDDTENVYIYVSGSSGVRASEELEGCSGASPDEDPNTALFRIEVIRVPLAHPEQAEIVSSPRIFEDLEAPPQHGDTPEDIAAQEEQLSQARAAGAFIVEIFGTERPLPSRFVDPMLDSVVVARGGEGAPTAADSAALREALPGIIAQMIGGGGDNEPTGPSQCHDITLYPAIGLAGGACGGYGLLLDISDPVNPRRIAAVADSNFAYWHSATFSNDGSQVLFTDEWGGGGAPKCRATDPYEWGADAIFTIEEGRDLTFHSYYKLPAPQTSVENCVAHNGSLIPVPGRDIMVQGWYQGGISIFDWTDPINPVEIAFHDRGPVNAEQQGSGGSWSVYWYNGLIVNSEISRGLDIFELTPSYWMTENEIAAAKSVWLERFNAQGQPKIEWPATFALANAYLDQLVRSEGLEMTRILEVRQALATAEAQSGSDRRATLRHLASSLRGDVEGSNDPEKVGMLGDAVAGLMRG